MTKKNKLIPFSMLPASWGLKGKARQRAEAEYNLSGIDLKKELAKIECDTEQEKQLAELRVEREEKIISESDYSKQVAFIKKEPWVEVKHMEVNPEDPKAGYMELDWNDEFVMMLQSKGYKGESDESVVNKWFNDVCRTVLIAELEDQDYGLENMQSDVITVTNAKEQKNGKNNRKK